MTTITNINLETKTVETADSISSEILENSQKRLEMIPNMYTFMANNPALLKGYSDVYNDFRTHAGFTPQEQEVVLLSVSYENNCTYCMAAHSFVADNMTKVPQEVTNAIRNNTKIPDDKLRALSIFTRQIVATKGLPSHENISDFLKAGYTKEHILGVITGVGVKTMSNYFNHIFNTPLDAMFKGRTWVKPE